MRPFLRLLMLWLIALALPLQGAAAMGAHGAAGAGARLAGASMPMSHMPVSMSMSHMSAPTSHMSAPEHLQPMAHTPASNGAEPVHSSHCPHRTPDKAGCGACCGPAVAESPALAVAPVATLATAARHAAAPVPAPSFLTGGPDRPPRSVLA